MAHSESHSEERSRVPTVESYGKILESTWRPAIGELIFEEVTYSTLAKIVDASLLSAA